MQDCGGGRKKKAINLTGGSSGGAFPGRGLEGWIKFLSADKDGGSISKQKAHHF